MARKDEIRAVMSNYLIPSLRWTWVRRCFASFASCVWNEIIDRISRSFCIKEAAQIRKFQTDRSTPPSGSLSSVFVFKHEIYVSIHILNDFVHLLRSISGRKIDPNAQGFRVRVSNENPSSNPSAPGFAMASKFEIFQLTYIWEFCDGLRPKCRFDTINQIQRCVSSIIDATAEPCGALSFWDDFLPYSTFISTNAPIIMLNCAISISRRDAKRFCAPGIAKTCVRSTLSTLFLFLVPWHSLSFSSRGAPFSQLNANLSCQFNQTNLNFINF